MCLNLAWAIHSTTTLSQKWGGRQRHSTYFVCVKPPCEALGLISVTVQVCSNLLMLQKGYVCLVVGYPAPSSRSTLTQVWSW